MIIYNNKDRRILEVTVDDNSYRHREVMGEHSLTLYYSLAEHVELPIGAYCIYQNERYELLRPTAFKMKHSRYFEYTVTMESAQAKAKMWKLRNTIDGRLKFPYTAKPHEHLQLFVDNMNRRDTGWKVGSCVSGVEKLISYDHDYCWDALSKMASEFDTEFEIKNKVVSLRKVEYNKADPLPLSYGRGNGFLPDIGRSNYGDTPPIEILYAQGGTENIDASEYGNSELLLPKNQSIGFDGEYFEDEEGYNAANARHYVVDDMGLSIRRTDKELSSLAEDSLDCADYYPKRTGKVTEVIEVDADNNFWDFIDSTIPEDLNFEDCLIDGETMTVIFQDGMLAGREFEVKYIHAAKTINGVSNKGRRFELVPQELDGITMPDATFKPAVNDTYIVFKCTLPKSYICDNATKSGAEWDMFRACVKYLFDNEEERFTFKGELDGIWAKKDWTNIGGRILLGGYVLFTDEHFQQEGVLVRITAIKDYINKPHSPEITLSNGTCDASFGTTLKTLQAEEVVNEERYNNAVQFTKRRYRDAQETQSMLADALKSLSEQYSEGISPISVHTMSMLIGDEALQFRFVDNTTSPKQVSDGIVYDQEAKVLTCPSRILQHMTLGITSISSSHKASEYKYWTMAAYQSSYLEDGSVKYYLYAKVAKEGDTGSFLLSPTAIDMEGVSGYYHLLVGILNSEYEGERSFATVYGYTEILPSRITTERVVSGDGNSYFDMLANAMKLGDVLDFNSNGDGLLRLRGTIVQSLSGQEEYLGCFRGEWNASYVYYRGDEVTFTYNGNTSTYRYIYATPSQGIPPIATLYWQVIAQGATGATGAAGISPNTSYKSTVFIRSNTAPATPTGGSYADPVPTGWSDGVPSGEAKLWASTRIFSSDDLDPQQDAWTTPCQMTDTATLDVEFSSMEDIDIELAKNCGHPMGISDRSAFGWTNEADETSIWMAISKKENGVWSEWQISRIKGEKGEDGTSISVKGTALAHYASEDDATADITAYTGGVTKIDGASYTSALAKAAASTIVLVDDTSDDATCATKIGKLGLKRHPAYNFNTGANNYYLYFWTFTNAEDGDTYTIDTEMWCAVTTSKWVNMGNFKGETGAAGAAGKSAYVHVKYAKSLTTNDWSDNNGETPDKYIGIYCDNQVADQLVWSLYSWSKWQGDDGFGYEYIYTRTATYSAPKTPTATSQNDDYVPSGWTDNPSGVSEAYPYEWICYRKKTDGVWGSFKGSASDNNYAALWAKWGEQGEQGETGATGDYFELRYAVNGSTTTPPKLSTTAVSPSGWSTTPPTVNKGYYFWMTTAKKSGATGALLSNWSTPIRISPYDGEKGETGDSPVMVYRGYYDSTKEYYGTKYRVDAVKMTDGNYYVARPDAGDSTTGIFKAVAPPNTDYWNPFGGVFESIATNLLLAEGANIGNWFISDGKIVSTLDSTGNKITLDAVNNYIRLYCASKSAASGSGGPMDNQTAIKITLDAANGIIEAMNSNYHTSSISPSGIFANRAGTNCISSLYGITRRAAMVALGYGSVAVNTYDNDNIMAGVYGVASNSASNPCRTYGGYFQQLMAAGMLLNWKTVTERASSGTQRVVNLSTTDSLVLGYSRYQEKVYLPLNCQLGTVIVFKQWWSGSMIVYPQSGEHIYDDHTENDYYTCNEGQMMVFVKAKGYVSGELIEAWLVNRFMY